MIDVSTSTYVINVLTACVPGALWLVLGALSYFGVGSFRPNLSQPASAQARVLLLMYAGYAFVIFFLGTLLLTGFDNIATIFGVDMAPVVQMLKNLGQAAEVETPEKINNFFIRDVHVFVGGLVAVLASIANSYWNATGLVACIGLALSALPWAISGFLIQRASEIDQIVIYGIIGFVSLIPLLIATWAQARIKWQIFSVAWFPSVLFFLTRVGIWAVLILANPVTHAIHYEWTEWIYPGFATIEIVISAIWIVLFISRRKPTSGFTYFDIYPNTMTPEVARSVGEEPVQGDMEEGENFWEQDESADWKKQ